MYGKRLWLVLLLFVIFVSYLSGTAMGTDVSVVFETDVISTGHDEETPRVAVDAEGNAHIVWASQENLYYKMVDEDGTVLIEETNLNPGADEPYNHVRRPSITLDGSGGLHIIFHGFNLYSDFDDPTEEQYNTMTDLGYSEVIYTKVNPSLDDRSGDAAVLSDILVTPETIISTNDDIKSRAPNMALDPSADRLHVVWYEGNGRTDLAIHYLVMDLSGSVVTAETMLTDSLYVDIDWGEPEIAVDHNGNAHVVYCTDSFDDAREIYYTMVDRSGTALIDDTRITADDDYSSVRATLAVDSQDMVHVIWHDKRLYDAMEGEHEIFYSKLDPSLDDQDGSSADASVISVIAEQLMTPDNDEKTNAKALFIDDYDLIHVAYNGYGGSSYDIYYGIFTSAGDTLNAVVPDVLVAEGDEDFIPTYWHTSSNRDPAIAISGDRAYVAFQAKEFVDPDENHDIYLSILQQDATPVYDASGKWKIKVSNVETDCLDIDIEDTTVRLTQIGNAVTLTVDDQVFTGTVYGSTYSLTAEETDEGETLTFNIIFTLDTSSSGTGTVEWTITDEFDEVICSGTADIDMERASSKDDDDDWWECFITTAAGGSGMKTGMAGMFFLVLVLSVVAVVLKGKKVF